MAAVAERMKREQFFDRISGLDREQLSKVLWTLYWRGAAAVRQRVEDELDAVEHGSRPKPAKAPPVDAEDVRDEVEEFVRLARAGSYLGGDRSVSPRERSRWRFTFRRLAADAQRALREPDDADAADGIAATESVIDFAVEMRGYEYFRSEDPVEAARFVVSDAVGLLWATIREREGFAAFSRRAAAHLVRWESQHGWTRSGYGAVSEKETSLASILADMLRAPDAWVGFTDDYLDALDNAPRARQYGIHPGRERARNLAEWNLMLLDRFSGTDEEDRLDRLTQHPALEGPERQYLEAVLAHRRGLLPEARQLMEQCLQSLPGHEGFLRFALEIDAELPSAARRAAEDRRLPGVSS